MNSFTQAQQAAVETMGCNLLVKAGAGAGKTRVLVERFLKLIADRQAEIDEIVAITFTRKAAREMKERIRERIRLQLDACEGSSQEPYWQTNWQKFDRALISTIHSLCSRILREFPAEAGVAPEFVMLDEAEDQALRDEIWQEVLDRAAIAEEPWLMQLLAVYAPSQLRDGFRPLYKRVEELGLIGSGLREAIWPVEAEAPGGIAEELRQACSSLFQWIPEAGRLNQTQTKLSELRNAWPQISQRLERIETNPEALSEIELQLKGLRGNDKMTQDIRRARKALQHLQGVLLDGKIQRLLPALCEWFGRVSREMENQKKNKGLLNYNDLESMTESLLMENPQICRRLCRRIRFVMVDECQDINERQRRIIYLLAGGNPEILQAENLFIVGDHKQSIYRFRGSDPGVFDRIRQDIVKTNGKVIELADNFRSRKTLVCAFNDFFQWLMPAEVCEEAQGLDAVDYERINGHRDGRETSRIEMWLLDGEKVSRSDSTRKEAEMIAARILELVQNSAGNTHFGDIAVLLRAFSHVQLYETAFANAGIPYCISGGRGFGQQQEIRDALNLIRYLDNPCNELALFGLLRSSFAQLGDATLLRLKQTGGKAGLKAGLEQVDSLAGIATSELAKIRQLKIRLARWEQRSGFLTPERILQEAFADTGFDLLQLGLFVGDRAFANLQKLLDIARAFADTGGRSLAEFLRYFELRTAREGEADTETEKSNGVRLMTIHKAKGLEFPIVIVPDLQRRFNLRSDLATFLPGEGMGLKIPDIQGDLMESARFRKILRRNHALEKAELKRLLYVAMTRAETLVVLSAVVEQTKTEKTLQTATGWIDWARNMLQLTGPLQDWPEQQRFGDTCVHIRTGTDKPVAAPSAQEEIFPLSDAATRGTAWTPSPLLLPIAADRKKPIRISPAYLAEYVHCPRRYYYSHIFMLPVLVSPDAASAQSTPGTAQARVPARQMGTVFHRFLERLEDPADFPSAMEMAITEVLPQNAQDAARPLLLKWASRYLDSAYFRETRDLRGEEVEWPFQYLLLPAEDCWPAVLLSGQIDRVLFYEDGSLGIVDFKTDWIEPGKMQEKAAQYRLQISGYAMAAKTAFAKPIRDGRLYFVRIGETAAMEVGEESLQKAAEELTGMAEFIRRHSLETDYPCNREHCPDCPHERICLKNR